MDTPSEQVSRPMFYMNMLGPLVAVAKDYGYALTLHGSLVRDFDMVAIPWVPDAHSGLELIIALAQTCGGIIHSEVPIDKPHGRQTWIIQVHQGLYLDVSVMPRFTHL
jgi:hypothetical protein